MWFIIELLTQPEAQTSAHYWASVLLAHAFLGVVLVLLFTALRAKHPVIAVSIVYALFEMSHVAQGGEVSDSMVDWAGVVSGALFAYALWNKILWPALVSMSVLGVIGWFGVRNRMPKKENTVTRETLPHGE